MAVPKLSGCCESGLSLGLVKVFSEVTSVLLSGLVGSILISEVFLGFHVRCYQVFVSVQS